MKLIPKPPLNPPLNPSKSESVPVEVVPNVVNLASRLGCKVSYLPMKNLGLLLDAPFKSDMIWNVVVERVEHILAFVKEVVLIQWWWARFD